MGTTGLTVTILAVLTVVLLITFGEFFFGLWVSVAVLNVFWLLSAHKAAQREFDVLQTMAMKLISLNRDPNRLRDPFNPQSSDSERPRLPRNTFSKAKCSRIWAIVTACCLLTALAYVSSHL